MSNVLELEKSTAQLVSRLEQFIASYLAFEVKEITLPLVLWTIGTHIFQQFDSFAYICITSHTKRCGKTRLSEVLSTFASNPLNFTAMTPSTLFGVINPEADSTEEMKKCFVPPTIVFDEAETLSSEAAGTMRSVMNVGYRKGQTIPRRVGKEIVYSKVYSPKIFILIGDTFDTLRDRSIIIQMKRADAPKRFINAVAFAEGAVFRSEIHELFGITMTEDGFQGYAEHDEDNEIVNAIRSSYLNQRAEFLSDRDEEIWLPILAVCEILCPQRMAELKRTAVDLAALKTIDRTVYKDLKEFETDHEQFEKAEQALKDILATLKPNEKVVSSADAVERLKKIDLAPWRKCKGHDGIDQHLLGDLLRVIGCGPVNIRFGEKIVKGYKRSSMEEWLKRSGVAGKSKEGKA